MTCRDVADFLADYVAGELRDDRVAVFEWHLSICPNCERYVAQYRATIELGRAAFADQDAIVPESVPDELITAILAARSR
jgi:anti-sigma factor RsiW